MSIRSIAGRIGMDYDSVIEDYCGDVPSLAATLREFPSGTAVEEMRKCIGEENWDGARKAAHALRKRAEKVGLKKLAEKAALIEEVSSEKMPHDFLQLEALYREICGIITEERL